MRKDIEIHINTGDIVLSDHNEAKQYPFNWVRTDEAIFPLVFPIEWVEDDSDDPTQFLYGEITVPASLSDSDLQNNGVLTVIPYTPAFQEFYLCIKRDLGNGAYTYVTNPTKGSKWFPAYVIKSIDGQPEKMCASELMTISDSTFCIHIKEGIAEIRTGKKLDFNIIDANRQNANMLLSCIPGNNYRYPLTGVGLIRWMGGPVNNAELAEVVQREFSNDGVVVNNAAYDPETNNLYLDLKTNTNDGNA